MAKSTTSTRTRNSRTSSSVKPVAKTYKAPSQEALGLNLVDEATGNITAHVFGAKDDNAKAIASIVFQAKTNVAYLNIHPKDKSIKKFSARVDRLARTEGMTMARLCYVASLTGHVFLKR